MEWILCLCGYSWWGPTAIHIRRFDWILFCVWKNQKTTNYDGKKLHFRDRWLTKKHRFWRQADWEKNSVLDAVTTLATSHTDTQTRKQYQDHTASEAVAFNHTNEFTVVVVVVVGLFHLIEDVLHVGKVEVGACRSAEDVKNVAACRLKVACCIVASWDVDLLPSIEQQCGKWSWIASPSPTETDVHDYYTHLTASFPANQQRQSNEGTRTPVNGPFSGTTQVSWYQKDKTNLDFSETRDSAWQQWH